MRKTTKKIISCLLSASMVLTVVSGIAVYEGKSNVSAEDAEGQKLSTPFTIELRQNSSMIFSWADELSDEGMTVATSSAIDATGKYSISAEAGDDVDSFDDIEGAIWITTDLKAIPKDFSIKTENLTVKHMDGSEDVYDWSKSALYHNSMKETGDVRLGIINHYVSTSASKAEEYGLANPFEDNVNGTWTEREAIKIVYGDVLTFHFTVEATKAPAPATPTPVTPTAKPGSSLAKNGEAKIIGTAKGKTFTKGNLKYKVLTAAMETAGKKTQGKVSVVGLAKAGKKAKKLSIPATVSEVGNYKVTAMNKNALKGARASSVTLGKNIKSIPAGAFANCKNLSKLTLNAKLTKVAKQSFKGCRKMIKIAGTAKGENCRKIKKVYKKVK